MIQFTHLHVHSQYSILDGAASVESIIKKVKSDGMTSVALTDHGCMFGIKHFHKVARYNGIKPILGMEAYMARFSRFSKDKSNKSDRSGYHLILLAKNETGYNNLIKLCSLGHIEGFYYKPRIDRELLEKYSEGLIVTSACLGGEISQKIMAGDISGINETIQWYKSIFGDDYYFEIMRHPTGDPKMDKNVYELQEKCNQQILQLSKKYNIKVIATNDCHFLNANDAEAHDVLICLNTGKNLDDEKRLRYTGQEYLKTREEMRLLFEDIPQALENTNEIIRKIESYKLDHKPVMPDFPIPENFSDANEYLRHITYEGATLRWGKQLGIEIKEQIEFELETIKRMGYPGYFLIVWDFLKTAREMGVVVGPGRGSAAGSAVAYSIRITDVDPFKFNLLFERFLNPDRISMPDIDIDLDDDGRQMMLDWVVKKYGEKKVAQIITFGTMAARLAIRDVGRVLKLPLQEADRLAKLVPKGPKVSFKRAYRESSELAKEKKSGSPLVRKTLDLAEALVGSIRQKGIHACGIIIGRDPLIEHIPLIQAKDSHLLSTQYEGEFVESVGMLKMDFLGLKTLTIVKEAIQNIHNSKGIRITMHNLPLDDKKTFDLFSYGGTVGVFQFESEGMRKHLGNLKPNRFEDLVAMNALYRPGPMEYIPSFIKRKHGKELISYDHPIMKKYLSETYGITVYQEQVMLLARALAGFTRGESDSLRKAMGKKIRSTMDNMKEQFHEGCMNNPQFIEGCQKINQNPDRIINKIWHDWEAFADYAFNKSHSVSYAYLAYYTAYLKAHYPQEFMAAVLSRNLNDIDELRKYMDECKRMKLAILGPDVNESFSKFTINKKGDIRFGLTAIKGVGEKAIETIIQERKKNGKFTDIYNFFERIDLTTATKTTFENIAIAGGFDSFGYKRSQFFQENGEKTIIETLIKYGQKIQRENRSRQQSLFDGINEIIKVKPEIPNCEEWRKIERLKKEKELIGIYLSAHPLDDYVMEAENFFTVTLTDLSRGMENFKNKNVIIGGYITDVKQKMTTKGRPYGIVTIEDYSGPFELQLFGKDFINFGSYCQKEFSILIKGKVEKQGWGNAKDTLTFKVNEMMFLSDAKEKLIKQLQLVVELDNLSEELIEDLKKQFEGKPGNIILRFKIIDTSNGLKFNMFSRERRIQINRDFFHYLKNNTAITYSFN